MQDSPVPYDKANLLTAGPSGNADRARMLVGGHTWVINPNTVNTARFTNNRISVYKIGPTWFSPQDVGINTYTSVPGHFNFSVTGFLISEVAPAAQEGPVELVTTMSLGAGIHRIDVEYMATNGKGLLRVGWGRLFADE